MLTSAASLLKCWLTIRVGPKPRHNSSLPHEYRNLVLWAIAVCARLWNVGILTASLSTCSLFCGCWVRNICSLIISYLPHYTITSSLLSSLRVLFCMPGTGDTQVNRKTNLVPFSSPPISISTQKT